MGVRCQRSMIVMRRFDDWSCVLRSGIRVRGHPATKRSNGQKLFLVVWDQHSFFEHTWDQKMVYALRTVV